LLEELAQVGARHPLHDEDGTAVWQDVEIVDGDDVGRLDASQELGLAEEALGRSARQAELDRDEPVEGLVAGAKDDSHAAAADLLKEVVARQQGRPLLEGLLGPAFRQTGAPRYGFHAR